MTVLQAQVQGSDLEGAKNVHKLLHKAAAPSDGGLALQNDENDADYGDDDDDDDAGGGEEGEMEEI